LSITPVCIPLITPADYAVAVAVADVQRLRHWFFSHFALILGKSVVLVAIISTFGCTSIGAVAHPSGIVMTPFVR